MSFSDLMSSAKGPGVIGLLLALVVLGGFMILGTLTLDDQFQGGVKTVGSVVRQQEKEIKQLRSELQDSGGRLTSGIGMKKIDVDLSKREAEIISQQAILAERRLTLARTGEELDVLEQALEDYKGRYRTIVRDAAKGKSLEQFQTLDGEVYKSVSIREVNAVGMTISHRDGIKRIPHKNLPLEMQDLYQFDEDETREKKAAEALARKRYLLANAASQKANQEQSEQKQIEEGRASKVQRDQAIAAISSRLMSLTEDIRRMEDDIETETQKKFSRAPQMREQLVAMRRQKAELESKLTGLRSTP